MTDLFDIPPRSGATFSQCGRYRTRLWRTFMGFRSPRPAVFVMLNPSTTDETANDPTVERCERRARAMGFTGLEVVNLFALRSTDPQELYRAADPIGKGNDASILEACRSAGIVICAWGAHGKHLGRGEFVRAQLLRAGIALHALAINRDGTPKHPLYVGYAVQPQPWEPES